MQLWLGLGNPGANYALHRHNVGFMVMDLLADRYRFPAWRQRFQGLISDGRIDGERTLLLKPLTFMNESGRSAGEALRFYKLEVDRLIVFHDELDLAPFKLRVKTGGGVAGHNGLRSLAAHLGTQAFKRVRVGIGHPGHRDRVTGHVLGNYAKAEIEPLTDLLAAIGDAAPLLAAGDDAGFMNKVALLTRPPATKGP
ncbi:MAG: aminoacyl-tRNA hydrolase [Geminicoccaceae bacterium]